MNLSVKKIDKNVMIRRGKPRKVKVKALPNMRDDLKKFHNDWQEMAQADKTEKTGRKQLGEVFAQQKKPRLRKKGTCTNLYHH